MMNEVRENFAEAVEQSNAELLAWENLIDSIYRIADTNQIRSLNIIDKLLSNSRSLDDHQVSELHYIKGDLYYSTGSFQEAVDEFTLADIRAPKYLAARAGAFVKLKQYENAWIDINKAARINYAFDWNVGNFYEIIGNKDSAISIYTRLYERDTVTYKFCISRVEELRDHDAKLLSEFIFYDRTRRTVLLNVEK